MKKVIGYFAFILLSVNAIAQVPGDTIKIKAFKYGSATRDTFINFPAGNLSFEKIIMKYNMRCKNGLVSSGTDPEKGCGQWDYSCNTYIVDSGKVENELNTHPSHIVSNFSGNTFNYTSQVPYTYYNYSLNTVTLSNVVSENQYTVATGSSAVPGVLKTDEKSGRTQLLYTAAELTTAGFTPGNIHALLLNVANSGGSAHFFKVGIQHSNATVLNGNAPMLTGFTNVYNSHYTFVNGSNRIQFHTPFIWNGTSNVLIDLSFTNTTPSTPVVFNGSAAAAALCISAKNNYAVDLGSLGHANLNTSLMNTISSEISVAFWAFGNSSQLPAGTHILYGYDNIPNHRQFSLQFPWSDNNGYFDCGYTNNGYDRVSKNMTAAEQGGQWNHWAFTKNTTSGVMNIYLNGTLWATGSGKTKPVTILNLILGKDQDLLNNYKGKINEMSIWNKELSQTDVQGWMNKPLDATHPLYNNLVAYYKMDEATGLTLHDSKNNLTSPGVNLQWTYDRGHTLTRMFSESNLRPGIVFLRGTYSLSTSVTTSKDSIPVNPKIVQQYTVVNNSGGGPFVHDAVNIINTSNLYQAVPQNVYNGDTGVLTGTIAVATESVLTITSLSYYKRYPFYNEIMSFVTPYGINLNLGATGKTWYFDVTDFTPILKGPKRMMMTLGGEYQEQMDIDFWFIVGTPPRNVLEFNQIWQGAGRAGGASIGSINNDTRFAPLSVPTLNNGQEFKLRSTITGHGAQGEFQVNGGQVTHRFNVNGGTDEFSWVISEVCSMNPVYPQGGTWVFDRQGWCPGQASLTKEYNLTPFITAGTTATLDYNCSTPPAANGDYRYIVANQLVTYGAANHTVDASIIDVLSPSKKVLYSRKNPICASPRILVQNTGSTQITDLEIDYWLNGAGTHQTFNWNGELNYMDTVTIILPIANLWYEGMLSTNTNVFNAEIKKVNTVTDNYVHNNIYRSPFNMPDVIPSLFSVEFKTNTFFTENKYTIVDDAGTIVGSSNFSAANTIYLDPYELHGCYTIIVEDSGDDGLQFFANTAQGTGYMRLKNSANSPIKTFVPDFGKGFEYSFTTDSPLSINKNTLESSLNLYPNPSHNKFMLEGAALENASVSVSDILGRVIDVPVVKNKSSFEFNTSALSPGAYFVRITKDGQSAVKKVIIY